MRPTSLIIRKMSNALSSMALLVIIVLMTVSCQKEESIKPTSSIQDKNISDHHYIPRDVITPIEGIVFRSIEINHMAGLSMLPDYSVTVYSDGIGVFEGRRGVRNTGVIKFKIPIEALLYINDLCSQVNFLNFKSAQLVPDMPMVATSYLPSNPGPDMLPRTVMDNNSNYPPDLIYFRTKVEEVLHISPFINTDGIPPVIITADVIH